MSDGRDAEQMAADRLLSDPGAVRARLDADLAEVGALGRTGARVDPAAGPDTVADTVRAQAHRLGFQSPVEAATLSLRRARELPVAERGSGSQIGPYHAAASATVAYGRLVAARGDRLVFHREAAEPVRTTVTLEAVVRVDADGRVWLDSFGWPRAVGDVPVYVFGGAAAEYRAQAEADLRGGVPFDRAMLMVLGYAVAGSDAAGTAAQRAGLAELVAARRGELADHVADAKSYALAARADGLLGACLYRSELESLFEDFLGSAAFALADMAEVEEIDEELQDVASDGVEASGLAVPAGMPPHHWWWRPAASR